MKNNKNNKNDNRVGRRIKAKKVRVIDPYGKNLGVIFISEALKIADEHGLDLVEVNGGNPPTCKILDYGKLKYQESKKEKKKEKKTYEIQFRPKIADHDLGVKIKNARKFLEKGSSVHLVVQFKGREAIHPDTGQVILDKACEQLQDVSYIIKNASMSGKRMDMILAPKTD